MQGKRFEEFIPLHLNPLEREPKLKYWLEEILRGLSTTFLTPEDWYTTGHGKGTFIWTPPPAAADVVVEQLGRARLKRPESMHIILVPRLMTGKMAATASEGNGILLSDQLANCVGFGNSLRTTVVFCLFSLQKQRTQTRPARKVTGRVSAGLAWGRIASDLRQRSVLRKLFHRTRALCTL